jgi:hypothetical protein
MKSTQLKFDETILNNENIFDFEIDNLIHVQEGDKQLNDNHFLHNYEEESSTQMS